MGKWAGLLLCILIATAWWVGAHRLVGFYDGRRLFLASPTGFHVFWGWGLDEDKIPPGWYEEESRVSKLLATYFAQRWVAGRVGREHILLPSWMVLLVATVFTALAWYLDRRRFAPGFCTNCGYNLTGNISGRCPECGTLVGNSDFGAS